jgi:hypothetical protein
VDPVPDPLPLRKSGSAGNRTRDLWISPLYRRLKYNDQVHLSENRQLRGTVTRQGQEPFPFSTAFRSVLRYTQLPILWVPEARSQVVNWSGHTSIWSRGWECAPCFQTPSMYVLHLCERSSFTPTHNKRHATQLPYVIYKCNLYKAPLQIMKCEAIHHSIFIYNDILPGTPR